VSKPVQSAVEETSYLLVRAGGEDFAVPVAPIVRVLRNLSFYGVPGGRSPLIGLSQYAGEPVPVIDLVGVGRGAGGGGGHPIVVLLRCGQDLAPAIIGAAVDEVVRLVSIGNLDHPRVIDGPVSEPVVVDGAKMRLVEPRHIGTEPLGGCA